MVEKKKKRGRPVGTKKTKADLTAVQTLQTMPLLVTPVFVKNKEATTRVVAHRGGARSSKSFSLTQEICERFFTYDGRKILVMRKTLPSLRLTTYKMMKEYLQHINMWHFVKEEKQSLDWHYGNSWIHFGSLDDPEKIKSSEWNDIWMEEATEFEYQDFIVLKTRMSGQPSKKIKGMKTDPPRNQLFLSFNPEDIYCWIKEYVIDNPHEDTTEIVSSWKDNPFLPLDYIYNTLIPLEKQNYNYYRIYTLGEWGQLDTLIFDNWYDAKDHIDGEYIYCSDFGYNAPSTLCKVTFDDTRFEATVEEMFYEKELTNNQFIKLCKDLIPEKDWTRIPLYADCAEPDRIKEIEDHGIWVVPTHKGKNSVKDGIDFVKRFHVGVLENSPHVNKERKSYSWRKDKKTERVLDEPVKHNDHAMDAVRSGLFTHWIDVIGQTPTMKILDWATTQHEDHKWNNWERFFGEDWEE